MDLTFSFIFTAARSDAVKNRLLRGLASASPDGWSLGEHSFQFDPHSQYVFVRPTSAPAPGDFNEPTMIPYSTFRSMLEGDMMCRDGIRYL